MAVATLSAVDATPPRPRRRLPWPSVLVALGAGSAALTVWGSWAGSRSDYYAAIAVSMSRSWPGFLFGTLDPARTVTLDKIPGSFWIPALFVKAFGFSTLTVVLPNALAATGAVLLVAVTARRLAGPAAGVISGAIAATTPIFVAVARSNQPEMFFVLALALVAWAATRALQRANPGWLVLAGVFIAGAFQCYMLEAWAVWPALGAAYLCTRIPLRRRIGHLLLAGSVSAALSVAWIALVWLVPSGSRPYIGSTIHNSVWEMVFGYNGLGRFGGATADSSAYRSFTPPYSGSPGAFRLFNAQLAGQVTWLVPAALLAVVILLVLSVPARVCVFLGGWLITFLGMFSTVAGMHQFYTASLALPVALIIGVAFARARRLGMLWPQICLLAVAAATALGIAFEYGGYTVSMALAQAVVGAVAIAALIWERRRGGGIRVGVASLVIAALVLTPLSWSVAAMAHPSSVNPVAGGVSDAARSSGALRLAPASAPQRPLVGRGQGLGAAPASPDSAVLSYVQQRAGTGKYLLAVFGAQQAATFIVASGGESILPIGGFNGVDPVPTIEAFTAMVQAGDVEYVLARGTHGFFPTGSSTSRTIRDWVKSHCAEVSGDRAALSGLYRCASN